MISKKKYLKALRIVRQYNKQTRKANFTPIQNWGKLNKCSKRLQKVLCCIKNGTPKRIGYQENFVENILTHKMSMFPNCGVTTLQEFIKMRGY